MDKMKEHRLDNRKKKKVQMDTDEKKVSNILSKSVRQCNLSRKSQQKRTTDPHRQNCKFERDYENPVID